MRRIFDKLREKKGYALLLVICVFALFTVLCMNALEASYAAVGSVSRKNVSTQAYYLATSFLDVVRRDVEEESSPFEEQIVAARKLSDKEPGATASACDIRTETGSGNILHSKLGMGKDSGIALSFRMPSAGRLYVRVTATCQAGDGGPSSSYTAYAAFLENGGDWVWDSCEGGNSYVTKAWETETDG